LITAHKVLLSKPSIIRIKSFSTLSLMQSLTMVHVLK